MKMNRSLVLLLALLLVSAVSASAGDSILEKVSIGTEVNVGWDRDLTLDVLNQDVEMDIETYLITFPIQAAEWLTVTPKVGVAHNSFEAVTAFGTIEADTEAGIAAGIDVAADVYKTKSDKSYLDGYQFTLLGAYLFSNTEIDSVDIGAIEINNPLRNDVTLHDLELGARVSKQLGVVTPYIGVAYTNIFGQAEINASVINLEDDIRDDNDEGSIGMRLGLGATPIENLTVSIDAKLFDQYAIGAKGSYKF